MNKCNWRCTIAGPSLELMKLVVHYITSAVTSIDANSKS